MDADHPHIAPDPERLLVVDDEATIRKYLHRLLSREGFRVDLAENGEEAMVLIEKTDYAVMLTDLGMPGMSGIDLVRKTREVRSDTINIVFTGYGSMESAIQALQEEVYDYLVKPVRGDVLLPSLRRALEKRRLRLENQELLEKLEKERGLLRKRVDEATEDLRRHLGEVRALNNEISILFEIMRSFRGNTSMSESLEALVSYLKSGLEFDRAFWIVLDGSGQVVCSRFEEALGSPRMATQKDLQALLSMLKGEFLFNDWEDRTMEWLEPFLPRDLPSSHALIAPLATSSELYGFVGITSQGSLTGAHRRILPLAVSQLVTVWEENTVLLRGSQMASMGELTAEFAHDLRNPLSAVRHGLGFLSSQVDVGNPKNAEYIEVLNGNLQRIEWLINEMIDFSRPSERSSGRVQVDSSIDRVIQVTTPVTKQKEIELDKHPCEEKLIVLAAENELVEALVNIVMNSVQATERGGRIGIHTRSELKARPGSENGAPEHLYARIDVTDTGCGIPPGEIRKVLGRFYTTKPNGTGLGLSVVQRVAKKNLGWVELESQEGEGTTVSLFFPQV